MKVSSGLLKLILLGMLFSLAVLAYSSDLYNGSYELEILEDKTMITGGLVAEDYFSEVFVECSSAELSKPGFYFYPVDMIDSKPFVFTIEQRQTNRIREPSRKKYS